MATSGVESDAMRLLEAFYDLSGGKITERVPLDPSEDSVGAARRAGLDPEDPESSVAVRYLVNGGYVEADDDVAGVYKITIAGSDKARELRGLGGSPASVERSSGMSEKRQRRVLTLLGIGLSQVMARPLMRFVGEQIPERRGVRDDVMEAVIKGGTRMAALAVASVLVRRLAGGR